MAQTAPSHSERPPYRSRLADRERQAKDKEARIAEHIASVKALLLNVWDMLGIDPDNSTIDEYERPTWKKNLTPHRPRRSQSRTKQGHARNPVRLHQDGLYFHAGTGTATLYNKRGSGSLPENPPSDQAIGDMVLNGWIAALQEQERERQSNVRQPDQQRQQHCEPLQQRHGSQPPEGRRARRRPQARRPPRPLQGKPGPSQDSRRAKALQRVQARIKADADYVAAAIKVKILAAKWERRYAAWDDECSILARTLTEHHFKPFTVYEIRYTPIGAPVTAVDEDGCTAMATEAVHTHAEPARHRRHRARPSWSTPSTTAATPALS